MQNFDEFLNERYWYRDVIGAVLAKIHSRDYRHALEALWDVLNRKKNSNEINHDLLYYATKIAAVYTNVNGYDLEKLYLKHFGALIESDSSTVTGNVANPDAKPMISKSTAFGKTCIDVDDDTYGKCISGKVPYKHWKGYVEDEDLRNVIKDEFRKNNRLIIRNTKTSAMAYVK